MPVGVPMKPSGGSAYDGLRASVIRAHQARELEGVGRAAPHEADDRGRGRHRETADPERLGDGAVAEVWVRILDAVTREVQPVGHADWFGEPGVAGARHADPEIDAVAGHRRHERRIVDAVGGVEGRLAGGHREVEEEVVVAAQEVEDRGSHRRLRRADERRRDRAGEQRRAGDVPVVPLVAHLEGLPGEAAQVDRTAGGERTGERRAEDLGEPVETGQDLDSSYAPKRRTLPSPSLRVACATVPPATFSTTTTGMDGLMTPAIGPTAAW